MESNITVDEYDSWLILHRISDLITTYEKMVFSDANVTAQQFWVLMTIALLEGEHKNPVTISDLVPPYRRKLASTSSIVDRMEKKGLIEKRIRDLPDRRSIRIIITEYGYEILKSASKKRTKLIKDLFANCSKNDLRKYADQNRKIRDRLEELTLDVSEQGDHPDPNMVTKFLNKLS